MLRDNGKLGNIFSRPVLDISDAPFDGKFCLSTLFRDKCVAKCLHPLHTSSTRGFLVLHPCSTLFNGFTPFPDEKINHGQCSERISPPPPEQSICSKPH